MSSYLRCPKCGTHDRLVTFASAAVRISEVTEDGFDLEHVTYSHQMSTNDDSHTVCDQCGNEGPLSEFYGPSGAYPGDSPEERAQRASDILNNYGEGNPDPGYSGTQLMIDLAYYFGMEDWLKSVQEAGTLYNQAVADAATKQALEMTNSHKKFRKPF